MRVLFVFHSHLMEIGFASSYYFPRELVKLGVDVTVTGLAGEGAKLLRNANVKVIEIAPSSNWRSSVKAVAAQVQPDIVHTFIHNNFGLLPSYLRPLSAKFIVDVRSPLLMPVKAQWRRPLVRLKRMLEASRYNAVIGITPEAVATHMMGKRQVTVIPGGVDFSVFVERPKSMLPQTPVRLVYVGSIDPRRKPLALIEAVLLANKKVPVALDIFGYGDGLDEVMAYINHHQAENLVTFHPAIKREELAKKIAEYDIGLAYVPRAQYDPGPPLKTLEYLAVGLPTIATSTIGNRVLIKHEENGLIADEDPYHYGDAIQRLAADIELRNRFAQVARRSVESFEWSRLVSERLIPLYERLLAT